MSSRSESRGDVVSAPPVFFLHDEAPEDITHVGICQAAERLVGFGAIVGAQRLGGLWRLYPTSLEVRAKLLTQKLLLGGKAIPLRSHNPFALRDGKGQEIPSTRLTVDGLPVSVASADLEGFLRKAGAAFRSPLMWEKARDREGKLTRWVTGRRFLWIDLPASPLPHRIHVGSFVARLYYREQPKPAPVCFQCGREGHRRGDPQCPGSSTVPAEAADDGGSGGEESVYEVCEESVGEVGGESVDEVGGESGDEVGGEIVDEVGEEIVDEVGEGRGREDEGTGDDDTMVEPEDKTGSGDRERVSGDKDSRSDTVIKDGGKEVESQAKSTPKVKAAGEKKGKNSGVHLSVRSAAW